MNLTNKKRSPQSANKISSKKAEFIGAINSLNYSIKEVYADFIKNNEKENSLIYILEKQLDKSYGSNLDIINRLKIYIDLDKKALDDFFAEAKIIFRKMKNNFDSLKQYLNDNIQIRQRNNLISNNLTENNLTLNNTFRIKDVNNIKRTNTPINLKSGKKNSIINSTSVSKEKLKKSKSEIIEKDKEIKNLKIRLKILEGGNTDLLNNFKRVSSQKLEAEKNAKELSEKYSDLLQKYSQLEKNCYDFKSDENKNYDYEEEYDLIKINKGKKEKNYSQDMNIDYPWIIPLKEKYKEINCNFRALVELVKNLLLTLNINNQNENIIDEIKKIIIRSLGKK
jgi:hypothetical protein